MNESQIMEWLKLNKPDVYYLALSSTNLVKNGNVRDLGKLYAEANEYIQLDWINENTNLRVIKRDEFDNSGTADGWDLITSDGVMKIQSKLRFGGFHIEQTRRNTTNNSLNNRANSGYIRYAVGEADVYLFSKPKSLEKYIDIKSWDIIAIPEEDLIDLNCPGFLYRSVPKKIWTKWIGRTKDVLEQTHTLKRVQ
jgi:hypothetical protein